MDIPCRRAVVLLTALCLPSLALAALGGSAVTMLAGSAQAKAVTPLAVANGNYRVVEMQTAAGVLVRQYSSAEDVVFGVTWQGPVKPDMKELLGTYFPQYTEAHANRQANRSPMRIRTPELVLHSDGRMRTFSGKAYLPHMLPPGVRVDDLR